MNNNPYQINPQLWNPNPTLNKPTNNVSPGPPPSYSRSPAEQPKIRRRPVPPPSQPGPQLSLHAVQPNPQFPLQPGPQSSLHTVQPGPQSSLQIVQPGPQSSLQTVQPGPQSFPNVQHNQAQPPPPYSPESPPSSSPIMGNTRQLTTPQNPVKGSAFKIFKSVSATVLSPLNAYTYAKPPVKQTSPTTVTNINPRPIGTMPPTNAFIIINGVTLDHPAATTLLQTGIPVKPGRYWYDSRCGAWGYEGGPCIGIVSRGLNLGGPMQLNASGPSATGVFINGRQIHHLDDLRLKSIGVICTFPGTCRWWINADGTYGLEGNLVPVGNFNLQAMVSGQGSSA